MDIILSSGFLAFASHIGFLRALEEEQIPITGVCGTSSGALVGALWLAGMSSHEIEKELFRTRPFTHLSLNPFFWQGLFSLQKLTARMEALLPTEFSSLRAPFGVGVCRLNWEYEIATAGSLAPFVVASCSIPYLFTPTEIAGVRYCDGGARDRIGAKAWRLHHSSPCLVHLVERSRGAKNEDGLEGCVVVRSPRSGASFWSFGAYPERIERTRTKTHEQLKKMSTNLFDSL